AFGAFALGGEAVKAPLWSDVEVLAVVPALEAAAGATVAGVTGPGSGLDVEGNVGSLLTAVCAAVEGPWMASRTRWNVAVVLCAKEAKACWTVLPGCRQAVTPRRRKRAAPPSNTSARRTALRRRA